MDERASFLIRVWMPDRPGVLGAVGTRIGAVKGDLVGIEILEQGAGSAVDELVVTLPDAGLVDLMVREINEIEGVGVESVEPLATADHDPQLDALTTAEMLVSAQTVEELSASLCLHGRRCIGATWTALVGPDGTVMARDGAGPDDNWLGAFVFGSQAADLDQAGDVIQGIDTLASPLPTIGASFVLGRRDGTFRSRERRRVEAISRIADAWFSHVGATSSSLPDGR